MEEKIYCVDCKYLYSPTNEGLYYIKDAKCLNEKLRAKINWLTDGTVETMDDHPVYFNGNNDCVGFEGK